MKNPARWFGIASLLVAAMPAVDAAAGDARLIEAVKHADMQTVRTLVAHRVDVNAADADGSTALHWAALLDNQAPVDIRLPAGANVAQSPAIT